MPFTLAHPAVVIPLKKHLKKWGVLSALIIGSMTPDFSYFLPLGISRYETHSLSALLWFCLPVGLTFYYIYHILLAPVLLSISPQGFKQRLNANITLGKLPSATFTAIVLSLLIGSATHIIWDLLTHPPHVLPSSLASWMNIVVIKFDGYTVQIYRLLQHLSTFLGIGLVIYWIRQWYKNTPPTQQVFWQPPSLFQTLALPVFILLPIIAGLIAGYLSASYLAETSQAPFLFKAILAVRDVIIYGGRYLLLTWLLLGITYWVLRYLHMQQPWKF